MAIRTMRAASLAASGLFALLSGVSVAGAQSAPAPAPALSAAGAAPAAGAALSGAELFQQRTCWACHGKDAKTPLLPNYPRLAGQSQQYAAQQIRDIKSGARNNGQTAAMKGVMHLVTDAEIEVLAEYLANLK